MKSCLLLVCLGLASSAAYGQANCQIGPAGDVRCYEPQGLPPVPQTLPQSTPPPMPSYPSPTYPDTYQQQQSQFEQQRMQRQQQFDQQAALMNQQYQQFRESHKPPNDVDLKAAYCIGVTASYIEKWKADDAQVSSTVQKLHDDAKISGNKMADTEEKYAQLIMDSHRKLADLLNATMTRLSSYYRPRLPGLEAAPGLAAMNQGRADVAEVTQSNECTVKCDSQFSSLTNPEQNMKCSDSCHSEASRHVEMCTGLSFLPY